MSALDQIVNVNIAQSTQAVPQASFSIPAVFGPSNRFAATTGITGSVTSGSNQITGLSTSNGISPGSSVSGTDIPAGTYILSVSGTQATMSQNAAGTHVSESLTFKDVARAYTSLSAMTADGFQTSDPEYIRSAEFIEQTLVPVQWIVGSYSASVAQVDNLTVNSLTGVPGHVYSFKINGQLVTYTSQGGDAQQNILDGLNAALALLAVPPATGVRTGTGGSANLALTSVTPGVALTYTAIDSELTVANVTPNHTITTDIAQAQVQNNSWYGCCICSNADGDITQVAAFIESQVKIFGAASNEQAIGTSSTTDLGSVLKAASYKRTFLFFSPNGYQQGIEAALMGGQLPAVPGSNNWAFKTLSGITVDTLTATQAQNCIGIPEAGTAGKNVNIYQTVGGVNVTQMGTMAGGQYIDITVGLDWLKSTLQTNIFAALVNAQKIPYTDAGTGILISAVRAAIDQGVANGLIDGASAITITAPLVLSVSANQRANRIAPTISFSCRLQGAFNAVIVNGTVTV